MSYDPGISGISGASDVFLNNPAASDALSYDTGTSKWVNSPVDKARVGLANVDNTSDTNKPVSAATQSALDLKAPLASPTFTGTVAGISKSMVGLGSVDNTSDVSKPVSTATQTALNAKADDATTTAALANKAPIASPTFTGTVSGITSAMVGLGSVDNTSDVSKPVSTATQTALDGKVNASGVPTLGFASSQDAIPAGAAVGSLWVIP